MFVLRNVKQGKPVSNHSLGKTYIRSDRQLLDSEEFQSCLKNLDWIDNQDVLKKIECVIYDEGGKSIPLFKGEQYYIMTESGKTFESISL